MNRAAKIIVTLFVLFVLTLAGAVYFFLQYQKTQAVVGGGDGVSEEEVVRIVGLVSQHVVLPENETPSVALVTNIEELRDQPFFRNAENGYQVLVYQQTGLAVMYDPQRDLVVNMAQISPIAPQEQTDIAVPDAPAEETEAPQDEEVSTPQEEETVVY